MLWQVQSFRLFCACLFSFSYSFFAITSLQVYIIISVYCLQYTEVTNNNNIFVYFYNMQEGE